MLLQRKSKLPIDAHEIYPGLWQGSAPLEGPVLSQLGFKGLVLCAKEHQPAAERFSGLQVIHAPNDDDFSRLPTREELNIALKAAYQVVDMIRRKETVLVTCWMGRNRSGLVSALALHLMTGKAGFTCMRQVRARRGRRALGNPGFQQVLTKLPAKDRSQASASGPVRSPRTT